MILALQTTTFSAHGGIPAYNRMVCRALNELDDVAVEERRVLIAMDRRTDLAAAAKDFPNLTLESFGGHRMSFVRRVVATALRERIDLALIGHVNHAPLGLLLKRLRPDLRYGVVVHGVEAWSPLPRIKRRALRNADFVMSVSEYTKRQVVDANGVNPEQVYVLPNTLAWDINETQRRGDAETGRIGDSDAPASEPVGKVTRVLSVCRLDAREQYKGVDTVIRALPAVLARVPDLEYVVVGSGSDLERHKRIAADLGVADRVQFLGSVDERSLRAVYESCDIFVLPSAGEGFGIVFLEAMHYRKPIIAANSGATPEVVKDGETGMLVESGNVERLAAAMIALCTNRPERDRMGNAGNKRLRENFTFDHFKRRLHEILLAELPEKAFDHGERQIAHRASSLT
ncbi:MAG TPA: glycosyltransferase family 4 protein [Pyrinomonadaceae bacterium]|nr:glycosyltransferase family 4 protein [Pyrinomonadaceae bacterium]